MHIAVVSLGAYGHVIPTLSFVTELVRRGVRVTYFTTENFRKYIESTGAKFVPVHSWMAEHAPQNQKTEEVGADSVAAVVPYLFLNEAGAYIEDVLTVLRNDRPDAIIHDFAGIAGTIAADMLHIPNIMLFPTYPSSDSFRVSENFEGVPADHFMFQAADQVAQSLADRYGCRTMTVQEIFDGHGDFNIVLMQKRFIPNGDDFDDSYVFTGAQIGKRSGFGKWTPPDNGKPLLYSSLGTSFNNWPEYYDILFDAVRDMDINVLVSLGSIDPDSLQDAPDNVTMRQMLPQLDVLSHTSVFITHAGNGSTAEAIYYGVPMIAVPQIEEQVITAGLIERYGLGISFPDRNALNAESLKAAIERVLNDPSFHETASEFSQDMKTHGGAAATADAILSYLNSAD